MPKANQGSTFGRYFSTLHFNFTSLDPNYDEFGTVEQAFIGYTSTGNAYVQRIGRGYGRGDGASGGVLKGAGGGWGVRVTA